MRYAESDGWKKDSYRPHIWRYRDYVVDAFNADKPYPDFVLEQLAGDEMPGDDPEQRIATGFLRLGIYEYNQRDARSHWNDIMNEITDVTGDVFLGLSMACSRCHDHKFDPLLQADYFSLRAFFEPIIWRDDIRGATQSETALWQEEFAQWEEATAEIHTRLDALIKPYRDRYWKSTVEKFPLEIQACFHKPSRQRNSWEHQMAYLVSRQFLEEGEGPFKKMTKEDKEQHEVLKEELAKFERRKPKDLSLVMAASDFAGAVSPTLIPNSPDSKPMEPRFLTLFSDSPIGERPRIPQLPASSGRRTALAEWIGRNDNPLTTRVIVNRIWQRHFGQGIVSTASDFGHMGQPPTHPELLDWLTVTFVENGWSFKHLHKLILMSSVWRQSASHPQADVYRNEDLAEALLWRARIRRLNAEQIRDAMLVATGELDRQVGGPSVDAKDHRRALYVKRFRNTPDEFLHAFDAADGLTSTSERNITTTPTQSLLLFNGAFVVDRASKLAVRIRDHEFTSCTERLRYAFRLTWGREPTSAELANASEFVGLELTSSVPPQINHEKLIDFCHALFNSNEFMYID